MIRHICLFRLVEDGNKEARKKFLTEGAKLANIPEIVNFSVVENAADAPASNYDVALIMDFNNLEDLAVYSDCEIHQEFKDATADIKTGRACIDYEF